MAPLALWLQCPIWYFLCFAQQLSLPLGCSLNGYDSPAFLISPKSKPNLQSKVNNWPARFFKIFFFMIWDVLSCYFFWYKTRGSNLTSFTEILMLRIFSKIHYCLKIIWVSNSLWGQLLKNVTSFLLARPGVWYHRIVKSEQIPILNACFWLVVNQYCVRVAVGLLHPNGGGIQN